MIRALFTVDADRYTGFAVTGHSGLFRPGRDILCAAVSSAVEMTANTITEVLKIQATVRVDTNQISLSLPVSVQNEAAAAAIKGLKLHLTLLSGDYPGRIQIKMFGRIHQ